MNNIPFTAFDGYLKQLDVSKLNDEYQLLFSKLFPRFYDKKEFTWDQNNEVVKAWQNDPTIKLAQPVNNRRFGGVSLPRKRYYAVSSDALGYDGGTLTNELRAYRDPVRTGMVEVLDLGLSDNVILRVDDKDISFTRSQELGIIIHEPQRFDNLLDNIQPEQLQPELSNSPVIIRIPYSITSIVLNKTVDLRLPETRNWFATQFSKPLNSWIWPETFPQMSEVEKPKIIYSKYKYVDERAPVPENFEQMLPTLLNPVLGGGDSEWGGNTLMGIGEFLRNEGVEAFIYPSSRCDAVAAIQDGTLVRFEGWCLVDYRYTEAEEMAHYIVLDQRPWCWVSLNRGVQVHCIDDDPEWRGSFMIEGNVQSGTEEYLEQIASLKKAEAEIGPKQIQFTLREAFAMGVYSLKWLLQARIGLQYQSIYDVLRIFKGIGLRNEINHITGEAEDIFQNFVSNGDFKTGTTAMIEVANRVQSSYLKQAEADDVIGAGIDLELVLLVLVNSSLSNQQFISTPLSTLSLQKLNLPWKLKLKVSEFITEISKMGNDVEKCSLLTVNLHKELAAYYSDK